MRAHKPPLAWYPMKLQMALKLPLYTPRFFLTESSCSTKCAIMRSVSAWDKA